MTMFAPRPLARASRLAACLTIGLLGLIVPLAGGCASSGGSVGDGSPEAYARLSPMLDKVGYRWDWTGFPNPGRGESIASIDTYTDSVVTIDSTGKVTVLESANGRSRWTLELANRLTRFMGTARDPDPARAGRLLVSTEAELFILDMANGNLVSRQHYDKLVNTRPLLYGPLAIYGTVSGEILGHMPSRGVKAWAFGAPGSIEYAPLLVGHAAAAVSNSGSVSFVDASSGSLMGRNRMYGGIACSPCVAENLLIVASVDQSLYAYAPNGAQAWRYRTPSKLTDSPAYHDGTVYCAIPGQGMTAFDLATGAVKWSTPDVRGTMIGVRAGRLVAWDGAFMATLEPQTGSIIERVELPGVKLVALDKFVDGNMYAVNSAGVVGKFLPR